MNLILFVVAIGDSAVMQSSYSTLLPISKAL